MLSAEFLIKSVPHDWSNILWGYKNRLIGWHTPIDIAKARLDAGLPHEELENELAHLGKDEDWKVGEILTILASRKHVLEDIIKRRWLFLVLLWLYQNRDQEIALFDKLGEVYADFDYPDEISSFVPFMPPEDGYDPTTHTLAENHNRILGKWKEYLDTAELSNFHRASLTLVRVILC